MNISERLQGFLVKLPPETVIRDTVTGFLQEKFTLVIDRKKIHIQKNNMVFLDVSPIIKARLNPFYGELSEKINTVLKEKGYDLQVKGVM